MPDQDKKIEREGELNSEKEIEDRKGSEKKESFGGDKEVKESSKEKPENLAEDLEKKDAIFERITKHKESSSDPRSVKSEDKNSVKEQAKNISKITDAEEQVKKLVDLAVREDPFTAIKVAQHLDENYVLDELHDELVEEKTRKILLEKGLLKKY